MDLGKRHVAQIIRGLKGGLLMLTASASYTDVGRICAKLAELKTTGTKRQTSVAHSAYPKNKKYTYGRHIKTFSGDSLKTFPMLQYFYLPFPHSPKGFLPQLETFRQAQIPSFQQSASLGPATARWLQKTK